MKVIVVFVLILFETVFSPGRQELCREQLSKEMRQLWKDKSIQVEQLDIQELQVGKELLAGRLNLDGKPVGYFISNRVNACLEGGCSDPSNSISQRYDHFYYLAIYNDEGKILRIKILEYQSERGYEIASRIWLRQFAGFFGNEISYENQIDALAGATVSANALIEEINYNARIINLLKK